MNELFKMETRAEGYPHSKSRLCHIEKGDVIFIKASEEPPMKVGDRLETYNAIVTAVHKTDKEWWQFWKKRRAIGYEITMQ